MPVFMMVKKNQRGFSLPELLIALVLASLVGMAAYTVFTSSSRSTTVQEDVSEAQQNVRIAMEQMAKDIRAAGFGLPDPPFSLSIGGETHSSPVDIDNSNSGPDTITLLGIGFSAGTLQKGSNTDCNDAGKGKICLNSVAEFKSESSFVADRRYVSLDGVKYFELNSSQTSADLDPDTGNKLDLANPDTLDRSYANGTQVFIMQAVRYTRNTTLEGCSSANPCLARQALSWNNQVQAQNIEDIQFAFALQGSASFDNDESSSDIDITAVRVNLVGRTRRQAIQGGGVSRRPQLEDHPEASSTDNYRRRVLTSVVKVRNPRAGS